MNNKYHKRAKILILIPIIVFAVNAVCFVPLTISYLSTGSDVTAVAIVFLASLSLIFTALPCMVMSVVGTVFASKAKKEGQTASRKFFVLGIIEIIIYAMGVMGAIIAVFITVIAANR